MRSIFVSALFFFGPVILIFIVRHLGLLLHLWLAYRKEHREAENVIDVTPGKPHPPSRTFILIAIVAGFAFAWMAWNHIGEEPEGDKQYVPAQMGEQGKVIPGQLK